MQRQVCTRVEDYPDAPVSQECEDSAYMSFPFALGSGLGAFFIFKFLVNYYAFTAIGGQCSYQLPLKNAFLEKSRTHCPTSQRNAGLPRGRRFDDFLSCADGASDVVWGHQQPERRR